MHGSLIITSNWRLCELQTHVVAMKASCEEAEIQLALTNESSKMLLERAGNLRDERYNPLPSFLTLRVDDRQDVENKNHYYFTLGSLYSR